MRSVTIATNMFKFKNALENILNIKLSYSSWAQSSLPIKKGGLGIRHAEDMALPCFLSSFHSVLDLLDELLPQSVSSHSADLDEALSLWSVKADSELPNPLLRKVQKFWEEPMNKIKSAQLMSLAASPEDKARLISSSSPESGSWLHTLPSPQLGTHLSNETFRISVSLRLGVPMCQPHICICGSEIDCFGRHGLSCKRSKGRISRHNSINDIIARALRSAEIPSVLEPQGCSREDGKRPDGMTLIPWSRGRSLVWDFTTRDTFAPSYLHLTSKEIGAAAKLGEEEKCKKYDFLNDNFIFIPISVETSGVWGPQGLALTFHSQIVNIFLPIIKSETNFGL